MIEACIGQGCSDCAGSWSYPSQTFPSHTSRENLVPRKPCTAVNTTWRVQTQLMYKLCHCSTVSARAQCSCAALHRSTPGANIPLVLCDCTEERLPCSLGVQHLEHAVPWCLRLVAGFMGIPCRNQQERSHALNSSREFGYLCWDLVAMQQIQDLLWKIITRTNA